MILIVQWNRPTTLHIIFHPYGVSTWKIQTWNNQESEDGDLIEPKIKHIYIYHRYKDKPSIFLMLEFPC